MNPFNRYKNINMTLYELSWPAELDPQEVSAALRALSATHASKGTRFVIRAAQEEIRHYLVIPEYNAANVLQLLHSFLPNVEINPAEPFQFTATVAAKLRMSNKKRVLNTEQPEMVSFATLNALGNLSHDESILVMWILGGNFSPSTVSRNLTDTDISSPIVGLIGLLFQEPQRIDSRTHASMQAKVGLRTWKAVCLIGVEAPKVKRASYLLFQAIDAMRSAEAPGVRIGMRPAFPSRIRENYVPFFWPLRINPDELTGLLAWPLGSQHIPGLQRMTNKRLPVSAKAPRSSRVVAQSDVSGSNDLLTLSPQDALMHTHVIGPTGVGKSTLLLNLITQDIANGRGVIVVDPKGDLVHDVMRRIPAERQEDVIILDPSDDERPVGLNPLAQPGQQAALVADDILSVFSGLYGKYFGPRTQDVMHSGLLTLCSTPGMSLCALPLLYTNPAFRNRLLGNVNDPLGLGTFWSWFDGISNAERNTVLAPVMNKLRAFLLRPAMRQVIGQAKPELRMQDVIAGKKILLVNLAKGSLGKGTSQLLGSLVIAQIWQAIQARGNGQYRQPFTVYVDEVQDYLHLPTDIGDVLAQARSYGVGMVLAHQHLGQLTPDLRSGILSNARSRICFQLGHQDALVMSRDSKILEPKDFENLSRYHVYARLVGNGEVLPWASGTTLEPSQPISDLEAIRTLSRQRYGRDAADVEADITAQVSGTVSEMNRRPIHRKSKTGAVL
jgi:hypothetical protein